MRRFPTVISLAACLALAGLACKRPSSLDANAAAFGILSAPGGPAPSFDLSSLDGRRVSLESLRGQVVFLNFWATWCPPCQEEMPSMMTLGRELEARNPGKFKMVAVSVDEGWEPVHEFFAAEPYKGSSAPLLVALDGEDQTTTTKYYCAARRGCPAEYKFPESYVIDRSGRLVAYVVGPRDWSDPRARAFLEQLLR